jgi:hypothetical protein
VVFLALSVATCEATAAPARATVERVWKRILAVRSLILDKLFFAEEVGRHLYNQFSLLLKDVRSPGHRTVYRITFYRAEIR